jgi:hypothetical protein
VTAPPGPLTRSLLFLQVLVACPLAGQAPLIHLPTDDAQHRPAPVSTAFHGCPAAGRASPPHPGGHPYDKDLDTRKNRVDLPPQYLIAAPSAIFDLASPNLAATLRANWATLPGTAAKAVVSYEGLPLTVEGYLAVDDRYPKTEYGASEEGAESTNCDAPLHDGDVHVWLTPGQNQDMTHAMIVELTPRDREALHQGSSAIDATKLTAVAKRGLRVRVSGWLLFDEEHPEQLSDRTERNGTLLRQRRATLWEIHPVTKLEILDAGGTWRDLATWNATL